MKTTVSIREAQVQLSRLIERAAAGEEVIISRGSTPVARLVPIVRMPGRRRPGALKDVLEVGPEFFERLPADELAGWE